MESSNYQDKIYMSLLYKSTSENPNVMMQGEDKQLATYVHMHLSVFLHQSFKWTTAIRI